MKIFKRYNKDLLDNISELNLNTEATILKSNDLIEILYEINKNGKLSNKLISSKKAIDFLIENTYIKEINNYLYHTNKSINLLKMLGIEVSEASKAESQKIDLSPDSHILNYYDIRSFDSSKFREKIQILMNEYPQIFLVDNLNRIIKINILINCIPFLFDFLFELRQHFNNNWTFIFYYQTKKQRKFYLINMMSRIHFIKMYTSDLFKILRKLLFPNKKISKGNFQHEPYSHAETLGRMIFAGFSIVEDINNSEYNILKLISDESIIRKQEMQYGSLFKVKRLGINNKHIFLYKIRTIYPYAEFIQEYAYKNYDYIRRIHKDGEFSVSKFGRIIRQLWLDELPMVFNIIKGDLKLVGVRALSEQYLDLYPSEFRHYRSKFKPGLIPPFYLDLPKTIEGIIESEIKYLNLYESNPIKTDISYFLRIYLKIFFKK